MVSGVSQAEGKMHLDHSKESVENDATNPSEGDPTYPKGDDSDAIEFSREVLPKPKDAKQYNTENKKDRGYDINEIKNMVRGEGLAEDDEEVDAVATQLFNEIKAHAAENSKSGGAEEDLQTVSFKQYKEHWKDLPKS